jgi:two-component system response regulator
MITELRDELRRTAKATRQEHGPIVIVEDDDDDRMLIGRELKFLFGNSPIRVFRNGQEFMDYLRATGAAQDSAEKKPRMILLDLHMPRLNGFSTLSMIRASDKYKNVPVIVISGTQDSEELAEAYERGATACLPKPASRQDWVVWQQCIETHAP